MDALAREIAQFIDGQPGAAEDERFGALVLAVFERQYRRNAPYRRLCDSLAATPEAVSDWRDVPPVPAQAFKSQELTCVPLAQAAAEFHSSGTTGPQTSRHFMDTEALALYERSLRRGFESAFPDRPSLLWALMPPPDRMPHSSLSHMLGTLGADRFFWDDVPGLASALRTAHRPLCLFGTAFAFVDLFDRTPERWRLPDGSLVIETGGFKGRTRAVDRTTLYGMFEQRLGVPVSRCASEYGMSEMASQFYGYGLDPVKRGPHWVRTRVLDPATGAGVADDAPGLLCHYDLANYNSVLAIETQDWGRRRSDGFVLEGRAPDASPRGCSLTVEDLWTSS